MRAEHGTPIKRIAVALGVSSGSVHLWTRDIAVAPDHAGRNRRRGRSAFVETWIEKHRARRREYQEEGRRRAMERDSLHMAGCMLYWAEGTKQRNTLSLANSDVNLVRFFKSFLTASLGVDAERLRIRVNVHLGNGITIADVERHWLEALRLPKSCLRGHSINHLPRSSTGNRRNRLPHGVCSLTLRDTRVVQHVYGAIQEYAGFDEPRWLDGPPRKRPGKNRG
jgi:hypothetical protein